MLQLTPNRLLPALLVMAACWTPASIAADCPSCADASQLRRIKMVAAAYPSAAKENRSSGFVELQFTVQPDGSTANIAVVRSEPPGVFEVSAITALSQWRYEPVVRNGKPVAQRAVVRIKFDLGTADWWYGESKQ